MCFKGKIFGWVNPSKWNTSRALGEIHRGFKPERAVSANLRIWLSCQKYPMEEECNVECSIQDFMLLCSVYKIIAWSCVYKPRWCVHACVYDTQLSFYLNNIFTTFWQSSPRMFHWIDKLKSWQIHWLTTPSKKSQFTVELDLPSNISMYCTIGGSTCQHVNICSPISTYKLT